MILLTKVILEKAYYFRDLTVSQETIAHINKLETIWDYEILLKSSALALTLEQDNQRKVNFKRSTSFGGLQELTTDHIRSLFPLYTQENMWHIQQQS